AAKLSLGADIMKDIGNVYCAALPAWIAAGMEEAYERNLDLAGRKVLAVGYGSGDAAEAIPMTVAEDWRDSAAKIRFADAVEPDDGFVIEAIGTSSNPSFSDEGIEYYRLVR